jgi:5-methylcytosine-specific restriction enzyme A
LRRYLTPRQKTDLLRQQGWKCGCGCGTPVWPGAPVEYDHTLPLALGGTEKPDSALAKHCHREKTKADVGRIAKADRQKKAHLGLKSRKGRAIPSRGFDKSLRKKMDGTVERRHG